MPQSQGLLSKLFKGSLTLCLLGGVTYGLIQWWTLEQMRISSREEVVPAAEQIAPDAAIELDAEAAERLGLSVTPAREVQWTHTRRVYGRVVPNSRATTAIHAPAAGRLRAAGVTWAVLGQTVSAGQLLGILQVRVGPEMRSELQNKLTEARLRQQGEGDVVKVHTRTVEGLQKVTDREILSRQELDAALVSLAEAKIQLAIADAAVALWQKSLGEIAEITAAGGTLWSQPIVAPRRGTVVEVQTHPGMEVEAGGLLLKLVDFDRALVRLDVPPNVLEGSGLPAELPIEAGTSTTPALAGIAGKFKSEESPARFRAHLVGPSAAVDISSQLVGIWYEVQITEETETPLGTLRIWKPGLQVRTELPLGTPPEMAVSIPASAVLFHEGRSSM